jgi:hypothetical protein
MKMIWKKSKNKFSIILSGLLALAIVLFSILSVTAVGYNHMQLQEPEQSEDAALNAIFDKQRDASEAGENIDEFLRCVPSGRTNRATSYPDYYAGSYIDGNGKLAVMLTDNTPEIRQTLTEAAGNSAVRFESAAYSHEELTQMMDIISAKIETNLENQKRGTHQPNICDDIRYFMLLDDQNAISVSIFNLTAEKIQNFKNEILDSEAIIFEKTTGELKEAAVSTNNWYQPLVLKPILSR